MIAPTITGHSAKVQLELHANGQKYQLAQIGGDEFIFERPTVLPGTAGEVVAYIDEHVRRWNVAWEADDAPRKIVPTSFRPKK